MPPGKSILLLALWFFMPVVAFSQRTEVKPIPNATIRDLVGEWTDPHGNKLSITIDDGALSLKFLPSPNPSSSIDYTEKDFTCSKARWDNDHLRFTLCNHRINLRVDYDFTLYTTFTRTYIGGTWDYPPSEPGVRSGVTAYRKRIRQ